MAKSGNVNLNISQGKVSAGISAGQDALLRTGTRVIDPAWCDYNGHMNMAYYAVVFDQAVESFFEALGLGAQWRRRSGCSFFSLSAMYHYLREVRAGEEVWMTFRVLDVDAKKVHFFLEMFREAEGQGERAATAEVLAVHIDMSRRRSAPMAADVRAVFERERARLAHLPPPPEAGARVGIRRAGS
jgi:acyl-CoA thioester hydrolase